MRNMLSMFRDFVNSRSMNEGFLLNEAAADDRFKSLFQTIRGSVEEMGKEVANQSGGKYDATSVSTIISLAFESLLEKGQTSFVNDVKDMNQGFARYRVAERNLDTAKNDIRKAKVAAKTKLDPNNLNGQSGSKQPIPWADMDNRAEQMVDDYMAKHSDMFDDTPENRASLKADALKMQAA